jgi:hypothetical protein
VSRPTAQSAVRDLVEHGILIEISGRTWGQLFLAADAVAAAQGTTETDPAAV